MIIKVLASGSKGNCYLVDDGQTKILIEAGISWREIQCKLDFKTSEIQACLISHMHQDHCKAINEVRKFGIPIFSPEYIQSGDRFTVPITNHTWNILAFDAVHDVPCLGFLLESVTSGEKLLYLSDSAYCKYRFEGLTHIMIGTNYDADLLNKSIAEGTVDRSERHRLIHAHASLQTVKEMLLANDLSKVQGIWLLHLSSRNADAERFKKEIQELTGKVLHLPDE
jgi:phosphoribosyl 1,2-cyclic phosphodiesterase